VAFVLCAAGISTLIWDYALLPSGATRYLLYWAGLALAYCGVAILGSVAHPRAPRQLLALAMFGAVTWLPYLLRSPQRLIFSDERFHQDIFLRIAEQGHTALPITMFPLPGGFPGLEDATLALMAGTGLSADLTIRVMTLAIHMLIPMIAYLGARGVGLGRRGSFLAALIYGSNTSYFFFHSVFSYESLGILLFLSVWALIGLSRGWPRGQLRRLRHARPKNPLPTVKITMPADRDRRPLVAVAIPLIAAVAVTHHLSSYILLISLAVAFLSAVFLGATAAKGIRYLLIGSVLSTAAWFLLTADTLIPYLVGTLTDRVQAIIQVFSEQLQPRPLFANTDVPIIERLIAFGYPPLVFLLCIGGLIVIWRERRRSTYWLPMALIGPIAWMVTTPAVITPSGEIAYRSWPFLFLGVAAFASRALMAITSRAARRWSISPGILQFAAVGVLLCGGFIIGDNQAGRFPTTDPVTAAGPGNATDEVVAAATWLRTVAGENHVLATDVGTSVTFATAGRERIVRWQSWIPFVTPDPADIAPYLFANGVEYVVVDRQIAHLPPRYAGYFGKPAIPAELDPGVPFPSTLLGRFDSVPELERIYDNGRIVIYRLVAGAGTRP